MYLYLITQDHNKGYDTYDSAVVVAPTEDAARLIHPNTKNKWYAAKKHWSRGSLSNMEFVDDTWADPSLVSVKLVGVASLEVISGEVICASFNAG